MSKRLKIVGRPKHRSSHGFITPEKLSDAEKEKMRSDTLQHLISSGDLPSKINKFVEKSAKRLKLHSARELYCPQCNKWHRSGSKLYDEHYKLLIERQQ